MTPQEPPRPRQSPPPAPVRARPGVRPPSPARRPRPGGGARCSRWLAQVFLSSFARTAFISTSSDSAFDRRIGHNGAHAGSAPGRRRSLPGRRRSPWQCARRPRGRIATPGGRRSRHRRQGARAGRPQRRGARRVALPQPDEPRGAALRRRRPGRGNERGRLRGGPHRRSAVRAPPDRRRPPPQRPGAGGRAAARGRLPRGPAARPARPTGTRTSPTTTRSSSTRRSIGRYDVAFEAEEVFRGRPTYRISFEPRPGRLPVRRRIDHALNKARGQIWIDKETYEAARVEFELIDRVRLWWGLLGHIQQARGSLDRGPVVGDLWGLPPVGDLLGRPRGLPPAPARRPPTLARPRAAPAAPLQESPAGDAPVASSDAR